MGTEGRGDPTWDVMGGEVQARKGGRRRHRGGYRHLAWAETGGDRDGDGDWDGEPGAPAPAPPSLLVVCKGLSHKAEVAVSAHRPFSPWWGEVGGGSRLPPRPPPPALLGFSGHPPGCRSGLPEVCVGATGDFLGVTPCGKMPGHLPTIAQLELSRVSTRRTPKLGPVLPPVLPHLSLGVSPWLRGPSALFDGSCLCLCPPHCLSSVPVSTHHLHPLEAWRCRQTKVKVCGGRAGPPCRGSPQPRPGSVAMARETNGPCLLSQPPPTDIFKRCLGRCPPPPFGSHSFMSFLLRTPA